MLKRKKRPCLAEKTQLRPNHPKIQPALSTSAHISSLPPSSLWDGGSSEYCSMSWSNSNISSTGWALSALASGTSATSAPASSSSSSLKRLRKPPSRASDGWLLCQKFQASNVSASMEWSIAPLWGQNMRHPQTNKHPGILNVNSIIHHPSSDGRFPVWGLFQAGTTNIPESLDDKTTWPSAIYKQNILVTKKNLETKTSRWFKRSIHYNHPMYIYIYYLYIYIHILSIYIYI